MYKLPLFKFPQQWGFKRTPRRAKELWVFNFEENYDWDNVWYDAVQVNEKTVLLIGPPLYDTADFLHSTCYFTDWSEKKLKYEVREFDRVCVTIVEVSGLIGNLILVDGKYKYNIKVQPPMLDFKDQKVIVTISKDHPIPWLQQWIDYHKSVHDLDGVLLYNNQSTIYTSQELEEALSRPDMTIKVVDYNVPFGCMGGGVWEWQGKSGTTLPWDSDFSQYIMLEHAKWKFLSNAKLVINADTDELLILRKNTLNEIADFCQTSPMSVWTYKGIWIEPVNSTTGEEAYNVPFNNRLFENYWHTSNNQQRGIGVKWMLNPKANVGYQWHLHRTTGPHSLTEDITFGHFLGLNTSWSWQRDKLLSDKNSLYEQTEMKALLEKWKVNKK